MIKLTEIIKESLTEYDPNTMKKKIEYVVVPTSTSNINKGWNETNSVTYYMIDHVRGYIERLFKTKYDRDGYEQVNFVQSYYTNMGGYTAFTPEQDRKFKNQVKRIYRMKIKQTNDIDLT